jgi:hypothetical protein
VGSTATANNTTQPFQRIKANNIPKDTEENLKWPKKNSYVTSPT